VEPQPLKRSVTDRPGLLALLVFIAISAVSCNNRKDSSAASADTGGIYLADSIMALQRVRLLPYWVPSAQFAGYYVGIEKGIFRKHGIDLELLTFDPLQPVASVIRDKQTDFAMLWMVNAMRLRDEGVEIVNIAQMSFRSSLMLISKKTSGIAKLEDMNGHRAGIWIGYELQPQALFQKYNLDVEIVPIGSTNNLFLQDGVDILNANWFDEYHSVLNSGIMEDELNTFFFADYGLNFLEDGIYCLNEMVKKNPELCVSFVEATLESWMYAFNNQEEAIEIVVKYARSQNQPVNRPHQRWMLSHYKKLYIPEGSTGINTVLKQDDYETIRQIMLDDKLISQSTPFETFYQPFTKLKN
jgi:NitT/TauT family transport system substrate-binding protein